MFERAIVSLKRMFLATDSAAPPPAVEAGSPGVVRWYVPDTKDRWLYRTGTATDPEQIKQYLSLAEQGEPRYLFAIAEEMYSRDAHIRSEFRKKGAWILGARRDVLPMPSTYRRGRPGTKAPEAALAQDAAAYVESQIFAPGVDFDGALSWLAFGELFGIAVLAVEVEPGMGPDGRERLVALRRVEPQRLRYRNEWEVRGEGETWYPLSLLKSIGAAVVIEFETGLVSIARRGLLRSILPLYLMRTEGPLWWGQAVQIFGMPIRTATAKGTDAKQDLALEFQEQGAAAFFSLPEGTEVKLLDALKGDLPHEAFLDWAAREISKAVHHSTQHADIQKGAGSTSSAESQVEVAQVAAQELGSQVATCITEQLFGGMISRNLGYEVSRTFTPEYRIRVRGNKTVDDMLKGAQTVEILENVGLDMGPSWLRDFMGIPMPEDGEQPLVSRRPTNLLPFPGEGNASPDQQQLAAARRILEAARTVRLPDNPANAVLSSLEKKAAEDAWKAGRELLKPYVALMDQAASEKWPLVQLLARVMHSFYRREASPTELRDTLAAIIAEAELRGIQEVRKTRSGA